MAVNIVPPEPAAAPASNFWSTYAPYLVSDPVANINDAYQWLRWLTSPGDYTYRAVGGEPVTYTGGGMALPSGYRETAASDLARYSALYNLASAGRVTANDLAAKRPDLGYTDKDIAQELPGWGSYMANALLGQYGTTGGTGPLTTANQAGATPLSRADMNRMIAQAVTRMSDAGSGSSTYMDTMESGTNPQIQNLMRAALLQKYGGYMGNLLGRNMDDYWAGYQSKVAGGQPAGGVEGAHNYGGNFASYLRNMGLLRPEGVQSPEADNAFRT